MSVMVAAGVTRPLATGAWGVRKKRRTAMSIDLGSYADFDNGQIRPSDLQYRIDVLEGERETCEEAGEKLGTELAAELTALLTFRGAVARIVGDFNLGTLVPDEHFKKHVRRQVEEDFGIGPNNIGDYVDWERYAKDQEVSYFQGYLAGQKIWIR